MIATRLRMLPGNIFELTGDTLKVKSHDVQERTNGKGPITIHRADGRTFEAVAFWAGIFRYKRAEYDPEIDGWRYYGVDSTAGWYVIDPEMTQPQPTIPELQTAGVEPDDGRGLFLPKLSAVAESFKKLFG